jgi:hypothetical protein
MRTGIGACMKLSSYYLLIACAFLIARPSSGQILVVDRGAKESPTSTGVPLGKRKGGGFVGDHFQIGKAGEVWIIDTIRTWVRSAGPLGNGFESVSLFGGIESPPPKPGDPPQPDCDCHNLMAIRSARLRSGTDELDSAGVAIAPGSGVRQVDFNGLHWSVPGGVDLQFGVMGVPRTSASVWINLAVHMPDQHALKVFDEKGKFEGPYSDDDAGAALYVQVWAHKSAHIAIRSAATVIEVALQSEGGLDAGSADPATLRFGPRNAASIGSRFESSNGRTSLIAKFRRADIGIPAGVASVCLTGRLKDGVPFEGCDLIPAK